MSVLDFIKRVGADVGIGNSPLQAVQAQPNMRGTLQAGRGISLQGQFGDDQNATGPLQGGYGNPQPSPNSIQLPRYFSNNYAPATAANAVPINQTPLNLYTWDQQSGAAIPYPAFNMTAQNGMQFHQPAYNGGWQPSGTVLPIQQPNLKQLARLPIYTGQ